MLSPENLQGVLQELTQALYNHEQWHKELTRTIICRLPHDHRDVAADAHRQCRFGQWYYGGESIELREHPVFSAMEAEHQRMHQLAGRLLESSASETRILPEDYDNFANALDRLRLQIQTLKRELEESLFHRDSLTGAESRLGMLTKLGEMRELARRRRQPCCIALMDLDHFKAINDSHGHLVGDQVLKGAVRFLRGNLRPYDRVFRYGGEEFLVLMPDTDVETGRLAIERLRAGLADENVAHDGPTVIRVTASFGLAMIDPDVAIEESMDRADKMMYAAKDAGRNCLRVWLDAGCSPPGEA